MILCGWVFGKSFQKKRRGWVIFSYIIVFSFVFGSQDLWNIGLVHKNKKNYEEAAPMLDKAQGQALKALQFGCNDAASVLCRLQKHSTISAERFFTFQRKDKGSLRVSEGKCVLFLLFCHRRKCHSDYALWPLRLILGTFFQAPLAAVHNIFPSALFFTDISDISYMLLICW